MGDFNSIIFNASDYTGSDFGSEASLTDYMGNEDPVNNNPPRPGAPRGSSFCSDEDTPPAMGANARYVPPHHREAKVETGDDFAMPKIEKKGDEEGVEGRHFGRLIIYCMIALTKATVLALNSRFPGCFFQSKDVTNHDHPIAHIVTQVGTNFLQRMIKAGSRVLDVYGNPKSCNAFNRKQGRRNNPKFMECIVQRFSDADFIREINKWGPMVEEDNDGVDRLNWNFQSVQETQATWLQSFSIFQCIHTLYYMNHRDIMHLLHSSPGSKILALIHSHTKEHGFLNGGEQEYWVKGGIVKQRNVKTNTVYYHPNITPGFFSETKTSYAPMSSKGFTWECHFVCEDTWIIEIAACDKKMKVNVGPNYKDLFEAAENDHGSVVSKSFRTPVACPDVLPTRDGKFIKLECENEALLGKLKRVAAGRDRTGSEGKKLMVELIQTAKHLVDPGALFPEAAKMSCEDGRLGDYCVKAFIADVPHETGLFTAMQLLEPILVSHTLSKRGKMPKAMSALGMMQAFRTVVTGAKMINHVVRDKDKVGRALQSLDDALDDKIWGI